MDESLDNQTTTMLDKLLKNMDDRLRCPICHDYLCNPVLSINCSHNFCSLCIRNFVAYKNDCPVCHSEINDGMLRPNRLIGEIISCYNPLKSLTAKSKTEFVTPIKQPPATSPREGDADLRLENLNTPGTSSTGFTKIRNKKPAASLPVEQVACPVCSVPQHPARINKHLDQCLKTSLSSEPKEVKGAEAETVRKHLPKLIYSIMKETELRKRLKALGLSTQGDRTALANRHKKFTIFFNAECDAVRPRPVDELIVEFERNEHTERKLLSESRSNSNASSRAPQGDVEAVEKRNRQYIRDNQESYQRLIEDIKRRNPPHGESNETHQDDEVVILENIPKPVKVVEEVTLEEDEEVEDRVPKSSEMAGPSLSNNIMRRSSRAMISSSSDSDPDSPVKKPKMADLSRRASLRKRL